MVTRNNHFRDKKKIQYLSPLFSVVSEMQNVGQVARRAYQRRTYSSGKVIIMCLVNQYEKEP